jgi:hypothetical protein
MYRGKIDISGVISSFPFPVRVRVAAGEALPYDMLHRGLPAPDELPLPVSGGRVKVWGFAPWNPRSRCISHNFLLSRSHPLGFLSPAARASMEEDSCWSYLLPVDSQVTTPARKVPKVEDLFKDVVCEVEDRERTPASSLPRRHLKTLAVDTRPSPPASSPHRSLPLERSRLRRRAPSNSTATRRSSGATPPQLRLPTRSPPPTALSHSSSCSGWILICKVLRCDFTNYWCPLVIAFCFVLQITMHAN